MTDSPLYDEEAAVNYLMRRLAMTSGTNLPAVLRFDLARMPISDDHLEQAVEQFGGPPASSGWGLNELLQDALSRQPASIPVDDLSKLQTSLVAQGYAPPDAEVTGTWDSSWYGAFRRLDSDSRSSFYQGHHPMAAPLEAGIRFLTNTVPSQVWRASS